MGQECKTESYYCQELTLRPRCDTLRRVRTDVKESFAARLTQLCDEQGLPEGHGRQTALAKRFGVTQPAARKWLEGENLPKFEMAIQIAEWAGVNVDWLLTGRGPRLAGTARDEAAERGSEIIHRLPNSVKEQAVQILTILEQRREPYVVEPIARKDKPDGSGAPDHPGAPGADRSDPSGKKS